MLARKGQIELQAGKPTAQSATMERSRLNQELTLALRRQDAEHVEAIEQQLAELPAPPGAREEDINDMLAKVNERNRKANLDAVRKSEIQEVERKRRERKLLAAAHASGTATPVDPSARLKTVPKLFNSISRSVSIHLSALQPISLLYISSVDLSLPLHLSCFVGQERRSQMGVRRCFTPKGLELQHDQYRRYHHLRCQYVWGHRTNPRRSKRVSLTRSKLILEISDPASIFVALRSLQAIACLQFR